jgi:hypothetical protein
MPNDRGRITKSCRSSWVRNCCLLKPKAEARARLRLTMADGTYIDTDFRWESTKGTRTKAVLIRRQRRVQAEER